MNTFFGTKISTTAVFADQGRRQTVSLIKATPLTVDRIKNSEKDGYQAIVCRCGKITKELRCSGELSVKTGDRLTAGEVFAAGDKVKITGLSKGRGFAGVVKRHGFSGVGGSTHGQSDRQRHPGSIGMRTTPGRVWKGKRMAGHYGGETITVKNLQIIGFDQANNILTVSGTVPGSRNSLLTITKI